MFAFEGFFFVFLFVFNTINYMLNANITKYSETRMHCVKFMSLLFVPANCRVLRPLPLPANFIKHVVAECVRLSLKQTKILILLTFITLAVETVILGNK